MTRPKPRISKAADGWRVTIPPFGFGPVYVKPGFPSHQAAGNWLASTIGPGSASQHVERTTTPEDSDLRYGSRWPVVIR